MMQDTIARYWATVDHLDRHWGNPPGERSQAARDLAFDLIGEQINASYTQAVRNLSEVHTKGLEA